MGDEELDSIEMGEEMMGFGTILRIVLFSAAEVISNNHCLKRLRRDCIA
jgi:hypothetical protein